MKESKDVWTLESGLEPGANSALCTCVYGAGRKGGLCTGQDRLDLLKPAHQDRRENDSGRTVPEGPESYDSAAPQAATAGHFCQANWNSWSLFLRKPWYKVKPSSL